MDDRNFNEVVLSGVINSIFDCKNGYVGFGLTCKKFAKNDNNHNVFISLRIYSDLYNIYKDYFFKGNKVFIKGYLNSYSEKDKIMTYIVVTEIFDNYYGLLNGKSGPHIRYDPDGVMVWDGKRCESEIATEEEQKEIKEILESYR